MTYKKSRKSAPSWLLPLVLVGGMYSCGSSSDDAPGVGPGTGKPNGASCAAADECTSGVCSTDGSAPVTAGRAGGLATR